MTDDDIHSKDNLSKFFDPFIYHNLSDLFKDEINKIRLTIVFWDISGFSAWCKELIGHPEQIFELLKEYYDEASGVVSAHNGILDKFIGDGIMAYFGYQEKDSAPRDAINAARELKRKFEILRTRHHERFFGDYGKEIVSRIDLKCGIHAGDVLFGYWKYGQRHQVTAIGDVVNFTSRLEGCAKHDQIIVSDEFNNILRMRFNDIKTIYLKLDQTVKSYDIDHVYEVSAASAQ